MKINMGLQKHLETDYSALKLRKGNNEKKHIPWLVKSAMVVVCALLALGTFSEYEVRADIVTDYLSVCVGYNGMELNEYVKVGKYHWSELEANLPMYELDYSLFQGSGETVDGVYQDDEYSAIVSSGYGFYITDLLAYANVYYGDIYNILFYVDDAQSIWTALDRDSLFCERYYFEDLPGHREVLYNELEDYVDYTTIIGYDFNDAWNDAYLVAPMLALESSWETFNEQFEHIGANRESMGTSSRFRLLYGQLYPTESMTRESAKYVSCVYVTLNGSPEYGEMPELDGTYGSHTVEMTVKADNESIRNALSQFMQFNSTNENVLVIKGYTLTPSDVYSDLATVTIDYEIVGEGEASISVQAGKKAETQTVSQTVQGSAEPETEAESETEPETESEEITEAETEAAAGQQSSNQEAQENQDEIQEEQYVPEETVVKEEQQPEEDIIQEEPAEIIETELIDSDVSSISRTDTFVYRLADGIMGNIEEMVDSSISVPADRDITKVVAEDNSEEEEVEQRLILLLTGAGCILICAGAFAGGILAYRFRLKYTTQQVRARVAGALKRFFLGKYLEGYY